MINFLIVNIKLKVIMMSFYRLETTKFTFTGRTEVRLGGCDMRI